MPSALLDQRGVLEVAGAEARTFLDRIVTCDVDTIATGAAGYGALLSPQGKILADFILFAVSPERFLLDTPAAVAADLAKRLTLYRLRAKIAIADRSPELAVLAGWDEPPPSDAVASAEDPRLAALGWRAVVERSAVPASGDVAAYDARRIALGLPEGGRDFGFGDAFPHEALMDQLGGVAFDKGCYVGQEVVSRMQHRGTARTRLVPVRYSGAAPVQGSDIVAGERTIGRAGTSNGDTGLAMIRLDRATDALAAGEGLAAAGVPLEIETRDWIRFQVPGQAGEGGA